jgi:hypothetical protein
MAPMTILSGDGSAILLPRSCRQSIQRERVVPLWAPSPTAEMPPLPRGRMGLRGGSSHWGAPAKAQIPVGLGALGDRLSRSVSFASVLS